MTTKKIWRTTNAVLVLLCGISIAKARQVGQSPPQFRSSKHLVVLDVTVTDGAGRAFSNLARKDFTVLEDGVPQDIETFEAPEAHTIVEQRAKGVAADFSLQTSDNSPVTVLVLDELNTQFKDIAYARFRLGKFLAAQPDPMPQPTALIVLTPRRLQVLANYSRDSKTLQKALNALPAATPWMLMEGGIYGEVERLQTTLTALDQIASANRDRQGRKNVVWVGSGFRLFARAMLFQQNTRDDATAAIREATRRLLQAHVTMYTVDPSGLQVDSDGHAEVMAADGTIISAPTDPATGDLVFEALAPATGGKIFRMRNDVDTEVADSVADGTTYYTLSYSPSNRNWDGKFRSIRVEVNRPGVKLRTRQGYYATQDIPEDASPDRTLAEAVKNPIPYAGISVKPEIAKLSSTPPSAQVTLGIDRHGLSWELMPDGRRRSEITAIRAELSASNEVLDYRAVQKEVFIDKGSDAQFQRSLSTPILFTMSAAAPNNATHMRFVICDTATGHIGTADLEIKGTVENSEP